MTTYLIVGASRGIGYTFVKHLGANPDNKIIVTVREESKLELINALGYKNITPIYIDMTASLPEFQEAFKTLPELAPNGIDVVIHNAGITYGGILKEFSEQDTEFFKSVFDVNVIGVVRTYISVLPVLKAQKQKFIYAIVSSSAGQIQDMHIPASCYGMSKAAVNYFAKQLSLIHPDNIVVSLNPGPVDTDMATDFKGLVEFMPPDVSVSGMLKVVEGLEQEDSGKFISFNGELLTY